VNNIYQIPATFRGMSQQQVWDMFMERERRMLELLNTASGQASGALLGEHSQRDASVLDTLQTLSKARSMLA